MTYESIRQGVHESFVQPEDGSIRLWRYIDLARLVALLATDRLTLVRLDLYSDEFEGSVTRGVYEAWKVNPDNAATMATMGTEFKRDTYVSSWHANNKESEAM